MPLLLIPGAFLATDSMKPWVAAFVAHRPVIVFDQQGHGRTADTPRAMSYEQFGDDAAALLHALEVERADVMGYIEKMRVLNFEDQHVTDAQMRSIPANTMVIVGDADGVKPEHAVAMFKLRGGGDEESAAMGTLTKVPQARLVILPATSHISITGAVDVLEPMNTSFLDDVPPATPSLW